MLVNPVEGDEACLITDLLHDSCSFLLRTLRGT
jgi:hypothetical protein